MHITSLSDDIIVHISEFLEARPKLRLTVTCVRFNKLTDRLRIRELVPYSKAVGAKNKALFTNLLIDGKHKNTVLPIAEFLNARHITIVDEFRGRVTFPKDMLTLEANQRAELLKDIESLDMVEIPVSRDYYTDTIKPIDDDNMRIFHTRVNGAPVDVPSGIGHIDICVPDLPLNLPDDLGSIVICEDPGYDLVLPKLLKRLEISAGEYNRKLILPNSLVELHIAAKYDHPLTLPATLEILHINNHNDHELVLPNGLVSLTIGPNYNKPLTLPESLTKLEISGAYTYDLKMPTRLLKLIIGNAYSGALDLPETLESLVLLSPIQPTNWPKSLKTVLVSKHYPFEIPTGIRANRTRR